VVISNCVINLSGHRVHDCAGSAIIRARKPS
jgi:hypothetical protein